MMSMSPARSTTIPMRPSTALTTSGRNTQIAYAPMYQQYNTNNQCSNSSLIHNCESPATISLNPTI